MAIKLTTNLILKSPHLLDARCEYADIASMKNANESILANGLIAWVESEKKYYSYDSNNTVDPTLGRWREFKTSGDAKSLEIVSVTDYGFNENLRVNQQVAGSALVDKIVEATNVDKKQIIIKSGDYKYNVISLVNDESLGIKGFAIETMNIPMASLNDEPAIEKGIFLYNPQLGKTCTFYGKEYTNTEIDAAFAQLQTAIAGKVDKVEGKGLSTNDYTDADKVKVDAIPTKTSELINDSGFITKAVADLENYYTKTNTYTKAEVDSKLSIKIQFEVVDALPATGESNKIYLVPAISPKPNNVKDEYIWVNNSWELIGSTEFNLDIVQNADGIKINNIALQSASALQNGLMTKDQVSSLARKAEASELSEHTENSDIHVTSANKTTWNAKYDKPADGIPKTDLTSDVQTSLGKADTALQAHQDISGKLNVLPNVDDPTDPGFGFAYHIPYNVKFETAADKATVTLQTITLDNKLIKMNFGQDIPAATITSAGLMSAADKVALNGKQDKLTAGTGIEITSANVINCTAKTYQPFPSDFVTSGTLEQVVDSMLASSGAKEGMAYLGGIQGACLPFEGNAECKVEFMLDSLCVLTINSSNVNPYQWVYNSHSGDYKWKKFSDVIANPSEAASQSISKISIDGMVYSLADVGATWGNISGNLTDQTDLNSALNAKYVKPTAGIPKTDLVAGVQTSLDNADSALQSITEHIGNKEIHVTSANKTAWNAKYDKPVDGIPKDDLTADVKTSLGKADTALQTHQDISGKADKTELTTHEQNTNIHVSIAEKSIWNAKIDASQKGANNGVAELDANGKVPVSQLPSYVSDIIEVDTFADLPTTGEAGKIYVTKDTNKTYRWSGTQYVEISASLALGETESTAYRGDRGKIAYDHSQIAAGTGVHISDAEREAWNAKYEKPRDGIGTSDLDIGVKESLLKADSALQEFDVLTGDTNGTIKFKDSNVAVKGLGTAAYTASTAYATAAQGAKADTALQTHQDISGKLNVLPNVDDPQDPGYGWPYHIPYNVKFEAQSNKAVVTLQTLTLDNNVTKMNFSQDIPAATTSAAGLMSAADKNTLDGIGPTKLTQDLTVTNAVGGVTAGTVYPAGTTLASILVEILSGTLPPVAGKIYKGVVNSIPSSVSGLTEVAADKDALLASGYTWKNITTNDQYAVLAIDKSLGLSCYKIEEQGFSIGFKTKDLGDQILYYFEEPTTDTGTRLVYSFEEAE